MAFASPSPAFFGASTARPLIHRGPPLLPRTRPRTTRSRILALGAAPTPPPPPESDADSNANEAPPAETPEAKASEAPVSSSNGTSPSESEVTAEDILSSPAFLKKKLEIVQKELVEARAAASKAEDQLEDEKASYVRLAADFDNYRRRSAVDMTKLETKATAKVCKAVLEVLDNFDRAIGAVQTETEREASIQKSYTAINKQLVDALTKLNVEPVDPLGERFDPEAHEAIQKAESAEYAEDVICEVYQKGYVIGENLIRPAIVAVSTGPGPEITEEPAAADGAANGEEATVEGTTESGGESTESKADTADK